MLWQRDDGYEIDTDPRRLDVPLIHGWLSTDAYWALGRSAEVMARAIRDSLCFGQYDRDGTQAGFARVVTDNSTFAWLCDVYVAREARGLGLGTWLASTVREHLLDAGLPRILLATADAHGVYAKAGFVPVASPDRWMEIDLRAVPPPA
jgi:GNAT superfamily N-acetyltransferase